jgi:hypothetical protein
MAHTQKGTTVKTLDENGLVVTNLFSVKPIVFYTHKHQLKSNLTNPQIIVNLTRLKTLQTLSALH